MVSYLIAAAIVLVFGAWFFRAWVSLPPERTPKDYELEVWHLRDADPPESEG